jgi:hypothetical protein
MGRARSRDLMVRKRTPYHYTTCLPPRRAEQISKVVQARQHVCMMSIQGGYEYGVKLLPVCALSMA